MTVFHAFLCVAVAHILELCRIYMTRENLKKKQNKVKGNHKEWYMEKVCQLYVSQVF